MAGSRGAERILNSDKTQFDLEQDELLYFVLNERYFKPWSVHHDPDFDFNQISFTLNPDSKLELYLTSLCNQNCEYCYLVKHKGLYPAEYNKREIILENLEKIFNWIIEKDFMIPEIEFFTGEIWQSNFGLEVLEKGLQAIKKGIKTNGFLIPSNCSFVLDEVQLSKIQRYINEYRKNGINLQFSISVDGAILENEVRPLNNGTIKTQEFYERLFLFAKHNGYNFHPMVASVSVDRWIENYAWWEDMFNKYDMDIGNLMMLEVRNNDWTPESIEHYNKFMTALMKKRFKECNSDPEAFMRDYFCFNGEGLHGYVPYAPAEADTFPGCTVANSFTIRVGDLAICPCHRTAYNQFLYGHFLLDENGKIDKIQASNPQMAVRILMSNAKSTSFKCDTCVYSPYCLRGCYGAQYEEEKDPFMPIEGVCTFFKAKWDNIIIQLEKLGILEACEKVSPYEEAYPRVSQFLTFVKEVKAYESEMAISRRNVSIRDCLD